MGKILRVWCEAGAENVTTYFRLKGDEDEKDLASVAETEFFNWANYGFGVIDESELDDCELEEVQDI